MNFKVTRRPDTQKYQRETELSQWLEQYLTRYQKTATYDKARRRTPRYFRGSLKDN